MVEDTCPMLKMVCSLKICCWVEMRKLD